MKYLKLSRRSFIGAGLSSAAAAALSPFIPITENKAVAQGGFPRRLVLMNYNGGSCISQDPWPTGDTAANFVFGSLTKCFEPYKDQMVFLKNLRRGLDGSHGSHQGGIGGLWTGQRTLTQEGPGPWVTGPSIDTIIANKIKQPVPFPTLGADVQLEEGFNLRSRSRFDMQGNHIEVDQDPAALFQRVFTNGIMVAGNSSDPKLLQRLTMERKSVLDLIGDDLTKVSGTLSGQDKLRMDQHLENLRSIEARLTPGMSASNGIVFKQPVASDYPKMDFLLNDNYPAVGKMHMDLLVAAVASDRTRLPSFQFSQGNGCKIFDWVGVRGLQHQLTHKGVTTPDLDAIQSYHFSRFAYFIGQFQSIKEGSGTMLDNSLIVFGNENHDGYTHSPDPSQIFMAGSGGGWIKTGRNIWYPPVDKSISGRSAPNNHTQLLVSLCHYMGVNDINQVGDPSIGPPGPLAMFP